MTAEIHPIHLESGSHSSREAGVCVMEAVAWAAGEPHSNAPACASPVLTRFMIRLNDRLDDDRRQQLLPYVLRMIGTRGDGRDEERREMCRLWLAERLPDLFERAGLPERAVKLRELLPGALTDVAVRMVLNDAWDEASAARRTAYSDLRVRVREELAKRDIDWSKFGTDDEAAVAVAEAAEAAVATAAEAAEAAVAVAAVQAEAVAVVQAEAAEAAVATAAATTVAVAVAAEAAVAVAVAEAAEAVAVSTLQAEAVAVVAEPYWKIRDAVRKAIRPKIEAKVREVYGDQLDENVASALALLDRMLPPEPLETPKIENAKILFPMQQELS
jgi:hypothetical protein